MNLIGTALNCSDRIDDTEPAILVTILTLIVTPVAYSIFDDLGITTALRVPSRRLRWLRERFGKAKADTRQEPSLAPSVQVGEPHPHLAEQVEPRRD